MGAAASRFGLPIAALIAGATIALSLFLILSRAVGSAVPGNQPLDRPAISALQWLARGTRVEDWSLLVAVAGLVVAVLLARRGQRPSAHYLALVAAWVIALGLLLIAAIPH